MVFSIEFRPSELKRMQHFPKRDVVRIKKKIDALANNLPDLATTKLQGNNPFHRIRCGDYRIIYEIHDDILVILVVKIGHRKEVHKKLS